MAIKPYLDKVGLGNLWGNIKNYITSKLSSYATKTELNTKANDSDVVHTTGDETINGIKYFTSGPQVTNNQTTMGYSITNTAIARNDVPSEYYHHSFRVHDKNNKILGEYCIEKQTNGDAILNMGVRSEDANGNQIANTLLFKMTNDGSVVKFMPSANKKVYLGDEGAKWLKVYSDDVVHTTGNETIEGTKTFSSNIVGNITGNAGTATKATQDANGNVINTTYATKTDLSGKANDANVVHTSGDESITNTKYFDSTNGSMSLVKRVTDYAIETTPTSTVYQHFAFQDKNNKTIAFIQYASRPSNMRDLSLYVLDANRTIYGIQINTNKEVIPIANNAYSLGSSSFKWLNVYASNFYGDSGSFSNKVEAPLVRANADLGLILANKDSNAPTTTSGWNQVQFYDKNMVQLGYFQLYSHTNANVYNWVGRKNYDLTIWRIIRWNVDEDIFCCSHDNTISLGSSSNRWSSVYATTVNTSILNIPQNSIVLAFCSSAVNNGSTVAGTSLNVASGGTGGTFAATTETLTGTYRALNKVVANGVGMFVKIA